VRRFIVVRSNVREAVQFVDRVIWRDGIDKEHIWCYLSQNDLVIQSRAGHAVGEHRTQSCVSRGYELPGVAESRGINRRPGPARKFVDGVDEAGVRVLRLLHEDTLLGCGNGVDGFDVSNAGDTEF
jgi:hypothetical protein